MTDLSPCPCCDGPAAFGNPPLGHQIYCLSMKCGTQSGIFPTKPMARNAWSKRASPAATPVCPADPEIAALYSALIKANIPFAAYSSNGFNLIGDSKSIKEATAAFHHHAQIDEFRTQIRHWREECGKLHAKIAAQEKS